MFHPLKNKICMYSSVFILMFVFSPLCIHAKSDFPLDLSKAKSTVFLAQNSATTKSPSSDSLKDIIEEVKAEDDTKIPKVEKKKEKIDPAQSYKIIAIYIIGNEPRALVKNLATPDELPVEYRIGDYLDESQTLSISKISTNPTARVEIVDNEGLSYLIKPRSADDKGQAGSKGSYGSYGSRSLPTYVAGDKSKSKKTEKTSTDSTAPATAPHAADASAKSADTAVKASSEAAPQPAAATSSPAPAGGAASTALQAVSTGASEQGMADAMPSQGAAPDSRPSNPFGE